MHQTRKITITIEKGTISPIQIFDKFDINDLHVVDENKNVILKIYILITPFIVDGTLFYH